MHVFSTDMKLFMKCQCAVPDYSYLGCERCREYRSALKEDRDGEKDEERHDGKDLEHANLVYIALCRHQRGETYQKGENTLMMGAFICKYWFFGFFEQSIHSRC